MANLLEMQWSNTRPPLTTLAVHDSRQPWTGAVFLEHVCGSGKIEVPDKKLVFFLGQT